MRTVIQRVSEATVTVDGETISRIGAGLCILLGVGKEDTQENAAGLADKVTNLRIFADDMGRMNRSALDIGGAILVISQFTLYGDCRRGNRPSFIDAAPPALAQELYQAFTNRLRAAGLSVVTGQFQAHMKVALINDGPVTLFLQA
ncbi:MAG TPA: D-aminoacyl-tRNA deacylase [Candidatus Limnocylindria bacterium]|nr:D-aminoacyl-tRNA deacylase [Candidatus Limnocylindria bacterium]